MLGTPPFNPSTPPFLPLKSPLTPPQMLKKITPTEEAAFNLLDMTTSCVADLNGNINSAMYSAKEAVRSIREIVHEEIGESLGDLKHICDEIKEVSEQMVVLKEIVDKMAVEQQACIDELIALKYHPVEGGNGNNLSPNLQHFIAVLFGMLIVVYVNQYQNLTPYTL